MRCIYLIGFMGSGKTTVAKETGQLLGWRVIDLDQEIEERFGRISDIFKRKGEHAFRCFESEVLEAVRGDDIIVSTGGGIVENKKNVDYMNYNGYVIHLQASFKEISKRLKNDTDRPLWNNGQKKQRELYTKRLSLYHQAAHFNLSTDCQTPEEIACQIAKLSKSFE
ncbi:Shikimate kinase [Lentibacillus sp. JNUCC-1]|uniref:shikimate kinase n=1 Tax=Lentibacillus sp. JNUCC-1 TaxID=2654513 RepID=UPI0012E928B1|nr:shikimate kinase [Lentibacillus sp. JNUCC-1]MUV39652.1 Shikimate kinase [Lentibacillus sp. JNUCC-1]